MFRWPGARGQSFRSGVDRARPPSRGKRNVVVVRSTRLLDPNRCRAYFAHLVAFVARTISPPRSSIMRPRNYALAHNARQPAKRGGDS